MAGTPKRQKVGSTRRAAASEFSQPKQRRPFNVFLIMSENSVRGTLAEALRTQQLQVQDYMTAMEFYRDYRTPVPGIVVTEIRLLGMTGVELFEKLTAENIDLMVAFISSLAEAPIAVQKMQAGVVDFLLRPATEEQLIGVVARAYALYYDTDWEFVGENFDDISRSMGKLSDREREVLGLVTAGYSSRDIAAKLNISTKTVEAHRVRIYSKTRAEDLPQLMRMVQAYNDE